MVGNGMGERSGSGRERQGRTDGERTENGKTVEKGGKWQELNERFERKAENETKRHLAERKGRHDGRYNVRESLRTVVNEGEREEHKE